LSNRESSQTTR